MKNLFTALIAAFLLASCAPGESQREQTGNDRTLNLIKEWVHGN